ncbi:hypothetical protein [Vulgatibacter sp.]|uniref:hypothetical protein n=1 Tax=Vulgatibacter sp. TaxID=1971226 RepID=UPI0035662235
MIVGSIALVVVVAVAVLVFFRNTRDEQALLQMDPERRAQLYAKELGRFRELCASEPPVESPSNCQEAARLLGAFPECDASCRETIERARQQLPR